MVFRKFFVGLIIAGLLSGCAASSQKINNVKLGMMKTEVIIVMGEPSYVAAKDDVEILSYKLTSDGLFADEYIVRIKNGKVDLFGKRYDFSSQY